MTRLFITGTGTEIGKTELTCRLIRAGRAAGRAVHAVKPIISGFRLADRDTDSARIAEALGLTWSRLAAETLSPLRFDPPISPDMAARRAGTRIDLDALVDWCCKQSGDPLLIEGVGGAFVPLNGQALVADWIERLGCPAVLVCGTYLGTISHTLATIAALQARNIKIAALILSQSPVEPVPPQETEQSLKMHTDLPIVHLPRAGGPDDLAALLDLAR